MYRTTTIKEIIDKANTNSICMPAIQRKFIWEADKIELLFDSIYKGFPIGTFLFWKISNDRINDFKFYYLLKDFDERNGNFNEGVPNPFFGNKYFEAILDGQQRITAIYIALQGSYTTKKKGAFTNNPAAYLKRQMYFNLLAFSNRFQNKDQQLEIFKMLTETEAKDRNQTEDCAWIKLNTFLDSNKINIDSQETLFDELKKYIRNDLYNHYFLVNSPLDNARHMTSCIEHLKEVKSILFEKQLISYYEITNQVTLDDVSEIFIRINSGGVVLSKTDLLFSTIITQWQDGRDKVDNLIKTLDKLGFSADTDFIMRTALYLTGAPILFKVDQFHNEAIIKKIIELFDEIELAITDTFHFLKNHLGITDKIIKSKNAIIPIIYHKFRKGILDKNSIEDVQRFLYVSALQKVFGSHGDSLLTQLRNAVTVNNTYTLGEKIFDYNLLVGGITDANKRKLYNITEEDLKSFLEKKKGAESWLVLSLIYGPLQYEYNIYDQDHLHPVSGFKKGNYTKDIERINKISNLCFATPEENRIKKNDQDLAGYLHELGKVSNEKYSTYLSFNNISPDSPIDIENFDTFYDLRYNRLYEILKNQFYKNDNGLTSEITSNILFLNEYKFQVDDKDLGQFTWDEAQKSSKDNWRLPTDEELKVIWEHRKSLKNFTTNKNENNPNAFYYWSSTEYSHDNSIAHARCFSNEDEDYAKYFPKNLHFSVRLVRSI